MDRSGRILGRGWAGFVSRLGRPAEGYGFADQPGRVLSELRIWPRTERVVDGGKRQAESDPRGGLEDLPVAETRVA